MHPALAALLLAGLFPFSAPCEDAWVGPHPAQRRPGTAVRIDLVGDSTQTDNAGYGRGFCANLAAQVDCLDMAKGGASTKTYRAMGLWERVLSTRPDYVLIQFGHNDMESAEHLERQVPIAQYETNLRTYVDEAKAHAIAPVLVTPLTRRYFQPDGKVHSDLLAHAEVTRRVAQSMHVPLVDLQAESIAYLDSVGEVAGNKLGISKRDKLGHLQPDKTHLNWQGSYVFGRMVAVDLGKAVPALQKYVLPRAATPPPDGLLAMRVYEGEPYKIVLVGDSTVAAQGGWGPGFCATLAPQVACANAALNGRSTRSFIDEGAWQKALDEKGNYYFIQFGHNDQKDDPARHTDPETTYAANLRRYIQDVRGIGGIPVILSPLSRRNYKDGVPADDGLALYAAAARRVAAEEHVTFVDLYGLSQQYLRTQTQEQADTLNAITHPDAKAENAGPAKPDRTHLDDKGKALFGRMVADNVIRTQVELGPSVNGLPEGAAPALQPAATDGH